MTFRDIADICSRKKYHLKLVEGSHYLQRVNSLCDCWELGIKWTPLPAGGAVICWAFWDSLEPLKLYTTSIADGAHLLTCMIGGFEDFSDRLVEPQKSLEYLHLAIGQCWSSWDCGLGLLILVSGYWLHLWLFSRIFARGHLYVPHLRIYSAVAMSYSNEEWSMWLLNSL